MSRRCDESLEQIYYFLDGELTWYRRQRIRWHLRRCDDCCGAFEFESHFKDVIRRKGVDEPPAELIVRLRAFLREHGSEGPSA